MLTAAAFADRCLSLVGLPYVLGAEWSPSVVAPARPRALDCSELVEGVFRENQTPIGDLAASQYAKTAAATGDVRVGDLVFLRNNPARWNGIGHVAVVIGGASGVEYVGNGQYKTLGEPIIVEARGRTWGVVKTTLSYWRGRKHYTGVRRFAGFRLAAPAAAPVPDATDFRLGQANLELWGGALTEVSFHNRGKFLHDKLRASVYLLCETSPALPAFKADMRAAILAELGPSWRVPAWQELAIAYDGAKWTARDLRVARFGVYQGALCVLLIHASGLGLDVITVHVRPGKVATLAEKKSDIRAAFGLAKSWPVAIGGDWNTKAVRDMLPAGFSPATPEAVTQGTDGALDAVFVRNSADSARTLTVRGQKLHNPGNLSDHDWWTVQLRLSDLSNNL